MGAPNLETPGATAMLRMIGYTSTIENRVGKFTFHADMYSQQAGVEEGDGAQEMGSDISRCAAANLVY